MQTNLNYAKAFEYMVEKKNLSLAIETVTTHIFATLIFYFFFCTTYALHTKQSHSFALTFNTQYTRRHLMLKLLLFDA